MRNLLAALFFSILAGPAAAQDAVLKAVHGGVELVPAGAKKGTAVKTGDTMLHGDTVRVKKDGLAHLQLAGGAVILLKPGASMTLDGEPENPVADVSVGEFLIGLAKKLRKGQTFRVRVPSAVAAVRGTLFWGTTGPDKKAVFAAVGHSIEVTAAGKTVVLQPNMKSAIEPGKEPQAPAEAGVTRDFLKTFAVGGSLQGLEKLADKTVK